MGKGKKEDAKVAPEWSHMIDVEDVVVDALEVTISPDEEEQDKLGQRLGVESLDGLEVALTIMKPEGSATVHVTGVVRADVTQNCVVSMEPVRNHVEDEFEAWFTDEAAAVSLAKVKQQKLLEKGQAETEIIDEKDDPETIIDGQIDVGELAVQHLSLAIDLYPRGEGVCYEHGDDVEEKGGLAFKNPFAALKEWKEKL